jgi:MoaA/NifB/PqqE/SkfB family radical SAM enzyme
MKCVFCNIWRRKLYEKEATAFEIKKRLVECWDLGCSIISFTGGEPLLRKDIEQLIKFSKNNIGLFTGLVTNGILLDKKIEKISRYTDALAVSFDVNNKQIFNRTRGSKSYELVKNNIKKAKKLGIEIDLLSVITNESYKFLDDTIDFAKSLELPIHFSSVDNVPRESFDVSGIQDLKVNNIDIVLNKLSSEKKEYKKIHFEKDYYKFQSMGGFNRVIGCSSASTTISLKPDGSVAFPCPFFTILKVKKKQKICDAFKTKKIKTLVKECGNWDFCRNCSINCMYVVSLIKHPYFLIRWIKDKI